MGTDNESIPIVQAWIDAVNAADMGKVAHLVADTVSIIGPRGSTSGRKAVAGWVHHTQIRMTVVDTRIEGDRLIAGVSATWQVDGGRPGERTPPEMMFMAFTVHEGRITAIQRLHSPEETVQD